MTLWMVRTPENQLSGPFEQEDIKKRLLEGDFQPEDELCPANSYWFSVHEIAEVRKFLGLDPPPAEATTLLQGTNPGLSKTQDIPPLPDEAVSPTRFVSMNPLETNQLDLPATAKAAPKVQPATPQPVVSAHPPIPATPPPASSPEPGVSLKDKLLQWEGLRWAVTGATILMVYGLLRFWMN